MSTDPDVIRRDIESTQQDLSTDIDALTDKISPRRAVERRMDRTRGALRNVRERIMGTASSLGGSTSSAASSVTDQASGAVSTIGDTVSSTPRMVRERTQGSPLAAGLIAFGVGVLVSSLLPPSQRERQLATTIKDKAAERSDQIREQVGDAASRLREEMREPARQAVESVRSTATDAASGVRDQARQA